MPDSRLTQGVLCVNIFEDANTNAQRDDAESVLPGVPITMRRSQTADSIFFDGITDPLCITLPPGSYSITAAPPVPYGLTTSGTLSVMLTGERTLHIAFGAANGYTLPTPVPVRDSLPNDPGIAAPVYKARTVNSGSTSAVDTLYNYSGLVMLMVAGGLAVVGWLVLVRRKHV